LSNSLTQPAFIVPEHVAHIVDVMSGFPAPWALGGGWAVDAWIGEVTREHGDVDVIVFSDDHHALFEQLRGWQLAHHQNEPDPGNELWQGQRIEPPDHLHGRVDHGEAIPEKEALWATEGWHLDVQFNERRGDEWVLSAGPLVTLPIDQCTRPSALGVPTVVPQVLVFYKAIDMRRRDKADFERLLPLLEGSQRAWLRDALLRVGHPWLALLPA
jgi:Aminoglycoside-2''-adenylyltransferase